MNLAQKKSLELMDEFFNNLSVDDFLADYLEVEDFEGVTVDEFIAYTKTVAVVSVWESCAAMVGFYHTNVMITPSTNKYSPDKSNKTIMIQVETYNSAHGSSSFDQSANDAIYMLAA